MEYVLITGGTSGIGYELARVFAANNYGIILVSSNEENLKKKGQELNSEYNTSVEIFKQDLSELGAASKLYDQIEKAKLNVDVLINNAGFGLVGSTDKIDIKKDEQLMILNNINLVELCKLFLPAMYKRKSGKILNIASTGAFQPGPYTSTYFASKAFVLSYTRAIRYEARRKGVNICVLCPGATKTQFFKKEGVSTPLNAKSPKEVAEYAFKLLMRNREIIIPGLANKIVRRIVPTKIKMRVVEKIKNI